ncbi:GntP family permease [Methylobacterium planeticum]|uniref:GntP family permease n=1 Tax=Methylobacterium planeticum TaxID=2615211 RepID=A0A6N6MR68_9HYPH|nr:GntP family permease [Methylobacterium planeticum]KAB1073966.1 GntP family permease [Methylobacterium planeticum]
MGLLGIVIGLGLLVGLAYRGWSILLLAPAASLVAALFAREPLLAHWTQTFMGAAAHFVGQYFPLFLLGALFGKLMEDSGSVTAVADAMTHWLGPSRTILAVVLAGALVTYGGVSLFVAFFVLAPMAQKMFRASSIPRRLMPAAIVLGTSTFTMSAMPGTPSIQNAIPMPVFGTTPFAAPGLGLIASVIMLAFGLWWLMRSEAVARRAREAFGAGMPTSARELATDDRLRERTVVAREFDPAEIIHGRLASPPHVVVALLPLAMVILVNSTLSLVVLPRLDFSYLGEARWGGTSFAAVAGVWSVAVALASACAVVVVFNRPRLLSLRESVDAGANASVLPVLSVASLVGFGAVVAAMPAFAVVRDAVLGIGGGPLVSLAASTNLLSALTGSASGGLTIALDTLGPTYLARAAAIGLSPDLLHRIAVIGAGTLDSLPHNGAVISLLSVCGATHRDSYRDIVMVGIAGPIIALLVVIVLGSMLGSF